MFPQATTHFTRFCRAKHMGPGPTIASMALSADVAVEALVLFEATVQHLRLVKRWTDMAPLALAWNPTCLGDELWL